MRYVLTAQDYQFVNSSQGQSLKALALSVPASVWESLDTLNLSFETEINEAASTYQEMLLESVESIQEIGKNQRALFYAAVDDLKLKTKEEYDRAVQEAFAVYEGLWDMTMSLLKALTEGGTAIGILHLILDVIGLIPGSWVGFPIDVVANVLNGVIYGVRGMWFLAVLSLIAAIPANYAFKGLKLTLSPFAKILDKLGIAIFKADKAAIKIASSELKTAAGLEKATGLASALDGFVQFAKGTLLGILKTLGGVIETILNKVTFGLVPKGKIVRFIEENVEVPLTKAVRGSEDAVLALREGDDVLASTTKSDIMQSTLTGAEKDELVSKFGKLATGDGDILLQVTKSKAYKQLVDVGAPKAAIEAYTNAAVARIAFDKALNKAGGILENPAFTNIMRTAGWKPEKAALVKAIRVGDESAIERALIVMSSDPKILKGLSESEAAVLKVYSKYPKEFIKHGKNFDDYLKTITRMVGKYSYRQNIGRKLVLFLIRQVAKYIMNDECYKLMYDKLASVKSSDDLQKLAAQQIIKEAEEFDKNSELYKKTREAVLTELELTSTPESEPEIHQLTIEAIKKAKIEQDCGMGAGLAEAVIGEDMKMSPVIPDNPYGGKELTADDYKELNTVSKNTLQMAGLNPNIDPVKNLSNANPIVKLYYADFYDPAIDKLVPNADESRIEDLGKRLVKDREMTAQDYLKVAADIKKHWEEGTEPVEVQQFLDSTKVDESLQINNPVKFLKFENFKNSINNK